MKIKKIDSSSVFGDTGNEYLKTKIKSYNNKIITNFHGKLPKEGVECVCHSAVVSVSFFKSSKNYYSEIFLEECKYKIKEKEIKSFIKDDLNICFDSEEKDIEENSE